MKAAIYSRFSTDKQTESSIADQVRVCTEYANSQGWTIVQRFEDQGISGAAMGNRPGLLAMLDGAKARTFDVLLVMDTSRLSRSSADLSKIADRLVFMGLRIVAVQEPGADTSKDGWEIYFGLSGLMGQQFRKMTAKKTHTALESRAKAGKHTGGRCFGYRAAPPAAPGAMREHAIAEDEAVIVREIFSRYAGGESQHAIAEDLNRRGIPSPRGRAWKVSAVHAMLHNDRYLGRLSWNGSAWRKDPDSGKRSRIERDAAEHVVTVREDLRIITDETWQRVRCRDAPTTGSSNARPKYALSGLLVCAECGKPMTLAGGTNSRGFGSRRYVCATYRHHKDAPGIGCSNALSVSQAVAERLLIDPLRIVTDPRFVAAMQAWMVQRDRANVIAACHAEGDDWLLTGSPAPAGSDPAADALLAAKLDAIRAALAVGALEPREAEARCKALREQHQRSTGATVPREPAAIVAEAEALRDALYGAYVDAQRDALKRVLGVVRVRPIDGALHAELDGADKPLLLALDGAANGENAGLSALVAGARNGRGIRLKAA